MKPLTLEETALKEEMKERCLAKGQYIDELLSYKKYKDNWNKLKEWLRIKDILANSKINPQSIKFKDLLKHMEYLEKSDNNVEVNKTIDKLRLKHNTQQKEFIEYLENEIYSFELRGTSPEYNFENVLKRILLKYKEIIGDNK